MNPWIIAAGAVLGLLRSKEQEKAAAEDRKVQSTKSRYATFTGVHGKDTPAVDMMGNIMQGAMAGAMMGQQFGGGADAGGAVHQGGGENLYGNVPQTAPQMHPTDNVWIDPKFDSKHLRQTGRYGRTV